MKHSLLSVPVLILAFLEPLFLQSGLDKISSHKANKGWTISDFTKSPLAGFSGILIPIITLLEVSEGILSALGIIFIVLYAGATVGLKGAPLAALSMIGLFFGQRLVQDYEGAATLATYFLISIVAIYCLWMF